MRKLKRTERLPIRARTRRAKRSWTPPETRVEAGGEERQAGGVVARRLGRARAQREALASLQVRRDRGVGGGVVDRGAALPGVVDAKADAEQQHGDQGDRSLHRADAMSPLSVTLPRPMRVLILGGDGYLGWPTALRFSAGGHEVAVVDNFSRRRWHDEHGSDSLTPILPLEERIAAWRELCGEQIRSYVGAVEDGDFLEEVVAETRPEAVVHYGEQPSAPYSMLSRERAVETQHTNVIGNLNLLFALRDHVPDCPPGQARHDGRVRPARHRHRGGLHRDRAQGAQGHPALPEAARLAVSLLQGPRLDQPPLRLPHLGAARHRPQPGGRLRDRDRRDRPRRAPDHPLRLRRAVRHRAQPLLRAGRDRPPADRLRLRRADPRLPQHPRHPRLCRAGGPEPRRAG